MKERERERDTERYRERDTEWESKRKIKIDRQTERDKNTERDKTDTERKTHRKRKREIYRYTDRAIWTDIHTEDTDTVAKERTDLIKEHNFIHYIAIHKLGQFKRLSMKVEKLKCHVAKLVLFIEFKINK